MYIDKLEMLGLVGPNGCHLLNPAGGTKPPVDPPVKPPVETCEQRLARMKAALIALLADF